jgi:cell division protein FtsN
VGLFIAFLVYLQMRPQQTDHGRTVALQKPPPAETRVRQPTRVETPPPPPAPKPRFDFYNLLPEMEVIVPEREISGTPSPQGVKRVEEPGTYLLQAGSFRSEQQAVSALSAT